MPGAEAGQRSGAKLLNVLVVDDSAVVRQTVKLLFSKDRGVEVTAAADPLIAQKKMARTRPDVILLDLEMPHMDGLTFLGKIMEEDPIPVVVCSGYAGPGTEMALKALEQGAVEVIAKPSLGVRDFLEESAVQLRETIKGAALAKLKRRVAKGGAMPSLVRQMPTAIPRPAPKPAPLPKLAPTPSISGDRVVVIGASTGGTEALRVVLGAIPEDGPPILIVQHMPEGFTAAFAERMNASCRIRVKEAEDGDEIRRGQAIIAHGNRHMAIRKRGAGYVVESYMDEPVLRHRPSVAVLFESAARVLGPKAVGVMLTGMGADGAEAMLRMKEAGATNIAQNEATSVVFGMPKEAIDRGAVHRVVALHSVAGAILQFANYRSGDNN